MSQARTVTVTLRTESDSVDLDNLVANFETSFPGVTASAWKKKGKHTNKKVKATAAPTTAE